MVSIETTDYKEPDVVQDSFFKDEPEVGVAL